MAAVDSGPMRCVVTAGPTFEPLDQVRRLTNFSTGRLGTELAGYLADHGHEVMLLRGEMATWPAAERSGVRVQPFTTTADLRARLAGLVGAEVDAVFHAAAVSDFGFGKVWVRQPNGDLTEAHAGKLSTRGGPVLAELVPTPKVIAELRGWWPHARLVGWKYEVDGNRDTALKQARDQIRACRTDAGVVNGPAYGNGFGLVCRGSAAFHHCGGRLELFAALVHFVSRRSD